MKRYNPKDIEPKWQKYWDENQTYRANLTSDKPKYIAMSMFNYPSGAGIHIGHAMNYTISDVLARFKRQQGYESYHPVGWDSFGLPAENYAIKAGVSPQESMATIIPNYHKQYKAMGWSNDWSKEIATHTPEYYKWTQWIFSEMYRAGLAYQDARMQWWCDKCQTVLANEQVINDKCWRHDGPDDPEVTQREVKQWFFKITEYADELLAATDDLDWTESVKLAQKSWSGKSVGAEVAFELDNKKEMLVFTTRPDTLFGATFLVIAPEHELIKQITTKDREHTVEDYVKSSLKKTEVERQANKEKTGVFTGAYAKNPVNDEQIPIWVADYVLTSYGTGAIMAVPAHDERDNEFAKKFDLPIKHVIDPVAVREDAADKATDLKKKKIVAVVVNEEDELLTINWGKLGGRLFVGGTKEAKEAPEITALREVTEETGYRDLEVEIVGEENFYYKYFAFSKNETHEIETTFVKLRLKSNTKQDQKLDDSEKGKFTVEWVSKEQADKEIVEPLHRYAFNKFVLGQCYSGEGIMTNSGEFSGMRSEEARDKIIAWLSQQGSDTIPVFTKLDGPDKFREDEPIEERDCITAIVKHWSEDKYIGLKWKQVDWENFITGGIEKGQTPETAAIAEIREETGYLNPKLVRNLGQTIAKFYHPPKKVNRLANFTCLYLELQDGEREKISEEENEKHEVVWLTANEVEQFNLPETHRYAWEKLKAGDTAISGHAREKVNFKMRDWSVSRQRYWGAPIPIIYCPQDGPVLVPDTDLPVVLPEVDDYAPSGDGRSALARATEWVKVKCPTCGEDAERETDTLDTYICSSWYMLRYFNHNDDQEAFAPEITNKWMPIDFYNGADHATAHMIYARFITRFFHNQGLLADPEPFKRFLFNGKVTAADGRMFSKSKGNGVDPLEIIDQGYGADALRTYLMFAAPLDLWVRWDPQGVPGAFRFLARVWELVAQFDAAKKGDENIDSAPLLQLIHSTIQKVSSDLEQQKYNTAIAALMQCTNELYKLKLQGFEPRKEWQFALESLVQLLAPFAPHAAEELWHQLAHEDSVHVGHWPVHDPKYLVQHVLTIVVQVNGKLRGTIEVAADSTEEETVQAALAQENIKMQIANKEIVKTIYVPGKLVNFVLKP